MMTPKRTDAKSCLCMVYTTNVANVRRWASERCQKRKAKFDDEIQCQRKHRETTLIKLREKHAVQIQTFDDMLIAETEKNAMAVAELELHYNDELKSMNEHLKQTVENMVARFERDYIERTAPLDWFCPPVAPVHDSVELVIDKNAQLKVVLTKRERERGVRPE